MATMNPRDPLTERTAHELRETERDPYDWWQGPHERPLLAERRTQWLRFDAVLLWLIVAVAVALLSATAALLWLYLKT